MELWLGVPFLSMSMTDVPRVKNAMQRDIFSCKLCLALRPPPTWQRSQNPPRFKKSPPPERVSGGVSEGPGRPPKTSQNEPSGDTASQKSPVFDSGGSLLTRFGGIGQDPRRLPQRLFRRLFRRLSEPGRVLTPLPGRGGCKSGES